MYQSEGSLKPGKLVLDSISTTEVAFKVTDWQSLYGDDNPTSSALLLALPWAVPPKGFLNHCTPPPHGANQLPV